METIASRALSARHRHILITDSWDVGCKPLIVKGRRTGMHPCNLPVT